MVETEYEWTTETYQVKNETWSKHTCPVCGCKVVAGKNPHTTPQETVQTCIHPMHRRANWPSKELFFMQNPQMEKTDSVYEGAMFKREYDHRKFLANSK